MLLTLNLTFDPNMGEDVNALQELGRLFASFKAGAAGQALLPFPSIIDPARSAAALVAGGRVEMRDVVAETPAPAPAPAPKPARAPKPASTAAETPAAAPAAPAAAPAAEATNTTADANDAIDYPTLQKAVAELFKLNPGTAAAIPTNLGAANYKEMPPAMWAKAYALVQSATRMAKQPALDAVA